MTSTTPRLALRLDGKYLVISLELNLDVVGLASWYIDEDLIFVIAFFDIACRRYTN